MKFLIFSPPYRNSSAGIRVLHRLGAELKNLGCDSFVFTDWKNSAQLIPHIGDCVVVYPESVKGNPLYAKNVVRYVLNTPGFMGVGDKVYPDSELVFVYSDALIPAAQAATSQVIDASRLMELSIIEPWLFRPNPSAEKLFDAAVWVGKGVVNLSNTGEKLKEYLTGKKFAKISYGLPSTREGLALLFQSCHEFVTVDDFTAMLAEAALCGCKTTIITPDGPVSHFVDPNAKCNRWDEIDCIGNFVKVCANTFKPVAAAAA